VSHLPYMWKFRVLRAIKAKGNRQNRRLLAAWEVAEGGDAAFNPMNTTQPWPGATNYNSVGVKNYPSASAGIAATGDTLCNGYYPGIVSDMRAGGFTAEQIVVRSAKEFDTWGTGSAHILAVLAGARRLNI